MSAEQSVEAPGASSDLFDVAQLVARWRDGNLDSEAMLRTEVARMLRPVIEGRTGPIGDQLQEAIGTVLDETSPLRRGDPAWGGVVPQADATEWRRWPAATFVASVVAALAERCDDIAPLDFDEPASGMPVAQRLMLRLVDVEGMEAPAAAALLAASPDEAFDLLDRAHDAVGMDPSGQVLCRGWSAVRAMDKRSPSERAEAQRHLANCRACGHAYADRLRRREFLLRLLPADVQRRPVIPRPRSDDLEGVDATEAIHRA